MIVSIFSQTFTIARKHPDDIQVRAKLPAGVDGWGYSLKGLMGMVVIGGLLITGTYFFTQRVVVPK